MKRPVAGLLAAVLLLVLTTATLQAPADATTAARGSGFFAGRLVDQGTGDPVHGAIVKVFRINTDHLLGRATSGPNGRFRIESLPAADEELEVRVKGSPVDYENGWVGCSHKVVPSWADACSFGQGRQSKFKLQHL